MIEFINLSFSYKGTDKGALRKLHLKIPESQCVLLCGVSGCGKTTLTRLVNGLIPHFFEGKLSGKVIVEEMNVAETEISTLSDSVGTVFQIREHSFSIQILTVKLFSDLRTEC